jgi:N-methylhydantoinase B
MHPIQLAVIRGALEEITNEMDYVFERMAFSPVISDSWDRADGIYHPSTGEVFAQGPRGMPIFVAVMQHTTKALIDHLRGAVRPGDIFVVNDPYLGGTHLMDVKMVMPFFYRGEHVAYLANTGHWPDVAGRTPGGFSPRATDVYQEGFRLPPVRLFREGVLDEDLVSVILGNTRVPRERRGDIRAQATALQVGARRLSELLDRHGRETVTRAIEELARRTEAQLRESIRGIPPGTYSAEEFLDSDGIEFRPLAIRLDLTVSADGAVHFDFSRSDPPCRGPMNSVLATTISSCCVAVKHLHPDAALNYGFFRPLSFTVPTSTFLNAQEPRPVAGCAAEVAQRIVEVVFGALAQAIPAEVPAGAFSTISNLALGGIDPDRGPYIFYSFGGGGYGGSSTSDGLTNGCSTTGLARTHSMEVVEQHYPIRIHEYAIRNESAGPGRFRGGFGTVFEFELLRGDAIVASLLGDRGTHPPRGADGGHPGTTSRHRFCLSGTEYVPPHLTKDEGVPVARGDRIRLETPGGGGFGPPEERDPELVARDVRRAYISRKTASCVYRVVVSEAGELDEAATRRLRAGADGRGQS